MPGYLLLTSKAHQPCCGKVAEVELRKVDSILNHLLPVYESQFGVPFAFEHGIKELDANVQSCLNHMHIHILPVIPDIESRMTIESVKKSTIDFEKMWDTLQLQNYDYIWKRCVRGAYHLYEFENLESQYVRKIYAEGLGISQWDWRIEPYWENIEKTLMRARGIFNDIKL